VAGSRLDLRLLDAEDADFDAAFAQLEGRRGADRQRIDEVVSAILSDVRARADAAVLDAIERFDGYRLRAEELVLGEEELARGRARIAPADRAALELAAERIRRFHAHRVPSSWEVRDGAERLGQRVRPLSRVGIYAPGGNAVLASTVLMLGIPASVAGVPDLALCTPGRELHPAVLVAAELAGIRRIYRIGGAQAVAALAYGTGTVRPVDKIVGPGNAYVQEAKRQVFGEVAIDAEAGPSEVFIVAEADASPRLLAADLLAQAEHDRRASAVLATPSAALARATLAEVEVQLEGLPSAQTARASLRQFGAIFVTRDLAHAFDLANRYGAEHLQLYVAEADRWLDRVENAGAIFLGPYSPVPLGDYVAGPSHVLPTGGTARFFSVVGVEDFVKRTSVIEFSAAGFDRVAEAAAHLAELEGLPAHARAVRARFPQRGESSRGGNGRASS
jgi:histidinol dehydrogenase